MTHNQLSKENSCSDWRASYGRLRRASAIESGLFKIQAKHLLQFRQRRQAHPEPPKIIDSTYRNGFASEEDIRQDHDEPMSALDPRAPVGVEPADQGGDLTRSFVRLSNLPTYPLDRLSRYEATLWRQRIRFCSRYGVSTAASHGRGLGRD